MGDDPSGVSLPASPVPLAVYELTSLSTSVQDLPLGLMDDIYEFVKNFSMRIDEVEEVRQDGSQASAQNMGERDSPHFPAP